MIRKCINEVCEICANRFVETFTVIFIVFIIMGAMYFEHKKKHTEISEDKYVTLQISNAVCGDLIKDMMEDGKVTNYEFKIFGLLCEAKKTVVQREKLERMLESSVK